MHPNKLLVIFIFLSNKLAHFYQKPIAHWASHQLKIRTWASHGVSTGHDWVQRTSPININDSTGFLSRPPQPSKRSIITNSVKKRHNKSESVFRARKLEARSRFVAMAASTTSKPWLLSPSLLLLLVVVFPSLLPTSAVAYRPSDIVPMSRMGQYHSVRSHFHSASSIFFETTPFRISILFFLFFFSFDCSLEPCGTTSLAATAPFSPSIARFASSSSSSPKLGFSEFFF